MPHHTPHDRTMFLANQEDALKFSYALEISENDSLAVNTLYKEYLRNLHLSKKYTALSATQKKDFDNKYKIENFSNYEQFKKSPYGKLNMFSRKNNQQMSVTVLNFQSENDAKEFLRTLHNQGIKCKIMTAPTDRPALRK